jgi:hypothetical protein
MKRSIARRDLIKTLVAASATAALFDRTRAADAARLDVRDPAAVALGYVVHASEVDTKKYPGYVKDQICENCLQLQGTAGENYRPCSVFPGKLVSVSGWCSAWAAEM